MASRIKEPVFIVGCCNSGTTILWQALLHHNDFCGPPTEGQDIEELPQCMRHFLGMSTFRMYAHPKFKFAYHLTEQDYDKQTASQLLKVYSNYFKPGKRFIEKSPANAMRIRFLQCIFPDAYFIIMVRNGYAVSEGIVRKRLYDPDRPHMAGLKTTIEEAAEQWYHSNRILLEDMRYLYHFKIVKYEDLVERTKSTLLSVLEFCNSAPENFTFPEFEKNLNMLQTARLSQSDKNLIYSKAGPLLDHYDYSIN